MNNIIFKMKINNNISLIVLLFFISIIFISKEIFIFNEEALVAIVFFIFVWFLYNILSEVFITELKDRSIKIENEFKNLIDLKLNIYNLLINHYKKEIMLTNEINTLFSFSEEEIKYILKKKYMNIRYNMYLQVQNRLQLFLLNELNFIRNIQYNFIKLYSKLN